MTERQLIDVHGGSLAVTTAGAGEPVLLVHAYPLCHAIWRKQIAALEATHRVIAPDLFGFGTSGVPVDGQPRSMATHADDLAAVLDALAVTEPVTFVGVSMAGYIGWEFVRRHRGRLGRLLLACTKAAADTPDFAAKRESVATRVLKEGIDAIRGTSRTLLGSTTRSDRPEIEREIRQIIAANDPRGVSSAQRAMAAREDMRDAVRSLDLPTLFIAGAEDTFSPPDEMREWVSTVPGSRFEIIEKSGHLPMVEQPDAFNRLLLAFLADGFTAPA